MAAAETRADAHGDRETNVVELPKLAAPRRSRRKLLRAVLLIVVPLIVLAIAAAMYVAGGRYVSTDNAYARAPIMNVTALGP